MIRPRLRKISDFNDVTVRGCLKAQDKLQKEGWLFVSYLANANDGVSSDASFTKKPLLNLVDGLSSFIGQPDPNHHAKNGLY